MSLSWTQPTCEACWIDKHSHWNDETGFLETIDSPVRVKDSGIEQCSYCGNLTIMGIYTREDPSKVEFPKEK